MPDNNLPMYSEPISPAQQRVVVEGKNTLRELGLCAKINLRGESDDEQFLKAAGDALGIALPLQANTIAVGDDAIIFWLGPNEWLLHCALQHAAPLMQKLQLALAPTHHAVTDVTDYYTVLELKGEDAAAILARGCPLDLHAREFNANQCAQTRFGTASVLLYHAVESQPNTEPTFNIQVRWSFTEYVWDYLVSVIETQ